MSSVDKDLPAVTATVYFVLINKKDLRETPEKLPLRETKTKSETREKQRMNTQSSMSSTGVSPSKNVKSKVNVPLSGQYSPMRARSPKKGQSSSRGASPTRVPVVIVTQLTYFDQPNKEKEHFDAYLQKLVHKHTKDVFTIVRDHSDVKDMIELNKRAGNLIDPSASVVDYGMR